MNERVADVVGEDLGAPAVNTYNLEVVKDDMTVATSRSVALQNSRAAWRTIAEFANDIDESGSLIRVTNAAGEVVIQVGVASARRYFAPRL